MVLDFFPSPLRVCSTFCAFILSPAKQKNTTERDDWLSQTFCFVNHLYSTTSATSVHQNKAVTGSFQLDLTLYNCYGYINSTDSECINHHRVEWNRDHRRAHIIICNLTNYPRARGTSEMLLLNGSSHLHTVKLKLFNVKYSYVNLSAHLLFWYAGDESNGMGRFWTSGGKCSHRERPRSRGVDSEVGVSSSSVLPVSSLCHLCANVATLCHLSNIQSMREQLDSLGLCFDWDRVGGKWRAGLVCSVVNDKPLV